MKDAILTCCMLNMLMGCAIPTPAPTSIDMASSQLPVNWEYEDAGSHAAWAIMRDTNVQKGQENK